MQPANNSNQIQQQQLTQHTVKNEKNINEREIMSDGVGKK